MCRDPALHGAGVKRTLEPQGPGKRATTLGKVEARRRRVHMCTPAWFVAPLVGYDGRR